MVIMSENIGIYHEFTASYFLAIFCPLKNFLRKIFHKLRVVRNIFFFLLLQAKDEMNSSHFPNHDSLIMHILVMFESDQENTTLSHHLTILFSFLQHFTELLLPSFFTSFLDAWQLLLIPLGIPRTCVGIYYKTCCKWKKDVKKK